MTEYEEVCVFFGGLVSADRATWKGISSPLSNQQHSQRCIGSDEVPLRLSQALQHSLDIDHLDDEVSTSPPAQDQDPDAELLLQEGVLEGYICPGTLLRSNVASRGEVLGSS